MIWSHCHSVSFDYLPGIKSSSSKITNLGGDKKSPCLIDSVQTSPIHIASIHDIEGIGFKIENIQHIDIV